MEIDPELLDEQDLTLAEIIEETDRQLEAGELLDLEEAFEGLIE